MKVVKYDRLNLVGRLIYNFFKLIFKLKWRFKYICTQLRTLRQRKHSKKQ